MTNRLINEQSLYLQQHAHNPVDWYPWGDEAFNKAVFDNKPVLVSIGYAACHWCHVMERESFENDDIAAFMNEHFICVKVDREEHPDVDQLYMDAVQAINGNGGWPLNVFVTPERIPFYGGTYFPPQRMYGRASWIDVLRHIYQIWHHRQDEVQQQSTQMLSYLKQVSETVTNMATEWSIERNTIALNTLLGMADKEFGGFGSAPKFPGTMAINFLLENFYYYNNESARDQALLSLDVMAAGGIYDQIGGGFSRYSTDKYWLAPHFEKMLYDNALIVQSLCSAYTITGNPYYKQIIDETLAFISREMRHSSGGYYAALDADSEGVEGKFYTFSWEEWLSVFPDENPIAAAFWGITREGNWEDTNILHKAKSIDEIALLHNLSVEAVETIVNTAKETLFNVRKTRIRPATDDKCILAWNALMNIAFTKAAMATENTQYLEESAMHLQWISQTYFIDNEWLHTSKDGTSRICAKLDDLAYVACAQWQYAIASGDMQYLTQAANLVKYIIAEHSDEKALFFYYSSQKQKDILVRKIDLYDGALPSANAVMAHNLYVLGMIMERPEWIYRAEAMLNTVAGNVQRYPYSYSYWASLLQQQLKGFKTVVIAGVNDNDAIVSTIKKQCPPHVFVLQASKNEKTVPIIAEKNIFDTLHVIICTKNACSPPKTSINDVLAAITT